MGLRSWLQERRHQAEIHETRRRIALRKLKALEHQYDIFDTLVNTQDEFEGWLFLDDDWLGASSTSPRNLVSLATARGVCRHLMATNGFARNFGRNMQNYIVGKGMTYSIDEPDMPVGDLEPESFTDLIDPVYRVWEEFVRLNNWPEVERELVVNTHRDGEQFLRFFPLSDGTIQVRTVDPADIKSSNSKYPEGIITDDEDGQNVVAYLIDDVPVDASEIEHIKLNTDRDVLRGWPTLWCVREKLVRSDKILRNMGKVTELQAAIAIVREQPDALDASDFGAFLDDAQDATKTDTRTQKTIRQQRIVPGAIVDLLPGAKIHFPVGSTILSEFVAALQAQLRGVAAALNLPEFMFTADASNANYSSTLVATAPATKEFESWQAFYERRGERVMERVIQHAIAYGRLPQEARYLKLSVSGPQVESRDELRVAQAREIEARNKVLSVQTWCAKAGYDYEQEQANRLEHQDRELSDGEEFPVPDREPDNEPEPNEPATPQRQGAQ